MGEDNCTFMVARTQERDPVWRTNDGPMFLMPDGSKKEYIKWWQPRRWKLRRLPKPHLTYHQVAAANEKSKVILRALRKGPIYMDRGFLKGRDSRMLTTKALSRIIIHWMEGNGFVFFKEKLRDGRIKIDIDLEATQKNKVI